jgi:hypothetical protein
MIVLRTTLALALALGACSQPAPSTPAGPSATKPQTAPLDTPTTMTLPPYLKAVVHAQPTTNYEVGLTVHADGTAELLTMFDEKDIWHGTTTLKALRTKDAVDLVYVKHVDQAGEDDPIPNLTEGAVVVTLRQTPEGVRGAWVALAPANIDKAGFVPAEQDQLGP